MTRVVQNTASDERRHGLSIAELDDALRVTDSSVLLVSPRILRRVIKIVCDIGGIGLRVPHRKTFVIVRDQLLQTVDRAELDLPFDAPLPETVILIGRPSAEALGEMTRDEALVKFWRQLFHARVHLAMDARIADGKLGQPVVRQRIAAIGEMEFEEIRLVLRQEDYLLPPKDDLHAYVEFAAVYLELRYFAPNLLRGYFPGLDDLYYIEDLLKNDADGPGLLAATRLAGAPLPDFQADVPRSERLHLVDAPHESAVHSAASAGQQAVGPDGSDAFGPRRWRAAARKSGARSHSAKRARARCESRAAHEARDDARRELARLACRLQAALKFTANEAEEWNRSLASLIENTVRSVWTPEARLLYDLQKVCVDHERGIYTLDVVGWAMSLGRKSLKRFLPGQRDVLMSKHLRGAARRVSSARLSQRARSRLAALLQSAVHRAEGSLRARFKPVIEKALDKVKLLPQNLPERVARKKLIEEILDRIVERGFLTMSDLRDSLSRNNLKLPDLASVRQFFSGDQLLLADRQLAESLDGVYHRGEIYLRLPQRLSSLAFGTPLGRMLTRYVALPFGGAYIALEGLQHLANPVFHWLSGSDRHVQLVNWSSVLLLGAFVLGLLHNQRFRSWSLEVLVRTGQVCRRVCVDFPQWLLQMPLVNRLVKSWQFKLFVRFVFKPLVVSLVAGALIAIFSDAEVTFFSALGTFLIINVLVNSPIGRDVDELVTDWVVQTWHRIRIHVIAALFRFVMDVFNRILEMIERFLYTIDEWLRFRAGERRSAIVAKAVLGSVWFFVNYFIRFCVTLLIEPQVNPIKHFPVVTVSHKVLIGFTPSLTRALTPPLGHAWALTVAPTAILLAPGIFGFLVWELKENWRLYAANRPPNLQPVQLGHHGETIVQFMRIGFRSGTVPKLYAKLRRANRKAMYTDNWKACSKYLDGLHHVGDSVRNFVDRELLELLHESRSWADRSITTGEVHLTCNRILIELYCPDLAEDSMWLAFEEQSGWLVASIHRRGWADALSYQRRHTLASALAGFYKMAGATLVHEQIAARLEPGSRGYRVADDALLVWSSDNRYESVYRLGDWPSINGQAAAPANMVQQPPSDRAEWIFAATPITWRRWVVTWELDQLDGFSKHDVLENVSVLPN